MVKPSHEVNNGSLSNMGFTKIGGKWVSKDGEQGGSSSGNHAEDDGYDQAFGAGPSAGNMDEHIISITSFERLMISCMDNLA